MGGGIFSKIRITLQSITNLEDINLSYEDAVTLLEKNNKNSKTSCIVKNGTQSNENHYQLSIIIPTYNNADFLNKCIESVLSQNFNFTYEMIIINDGSTDHTNKVLDEYRNKQCIKIIEQKNKGFSGARNTGIDFATGEYLMFLDSDDIILPNGINSLLSYAYQFEADIVEGGFETLYSDGISRKFPSSSEIVKPLIALGNLHGYLWGKVYKRELFDGIRLPEGYWFEDSLNAHILFCKCKKCYQIPELVYGYFQNDKSITHTSKKAKKSIDSLYITESLIKDHLSLGFEITQEYYEYFLRMVKLTYVRTRELDEDIRKAIFVYQCKLFHLYFVSFYSKISNMKNLEKALNCQNYKQYVKCLEW